MSHNVRYFRTKGLYSLSHSTAASTLSGRIPSVLSRVYCHRIDGTIKVGRYVYSGVFENLATISDASTSLEEKTAHP